MGLSRKAFGGLRRQRIISYNAAFDDFAKQNHQKRRYKKFYGVL
jgi:hypothetical protein